MSALMRSALRYGLRCLALSSCYCYLDPELLPALRAAAPRPPDVVVRPVEDDPGWPRYAWSGTRGHVT